MDLIDACKEIIRDKFNELDRYREDEGPASDVDSLHTQNQLPAHDAAGRDTDQNLNKIITQQAYLKRMLDQDNHIQMLTSALKTVTLEIENLRETCTKMNEEALKQRGELVVTQAKDIERFQMGQIRSISEDYSRHQEILEQRKKEIQSLKREIEREERDRAAYLMDVEKKLDKQLQDRQKALRSGSLPFGLPSSVNDEQHNPDHLELTSVDEYAPYGTAPHSRLPATRAAANRGRGRGLRARRGRRGG